MKWPKRRAVNRKFGNRYYAIHKTRLAGETGGRPLEITAENLRQQGWNARIEEYSNGDKALFINAKLQKFNARRRGRRGRRRRGPWRPPERPSQQDDLNPQAIFNRWKNDLGRTVQTRMFSTTNTLRDQYSENMLQQYGRGPPGAMTIDRFFNSSMFRAADTGEADLRMCLECSGTGGLFEPSMGINDPCAACDRTGVLTDEQFTQLYPTNADSTFFPSNGRFGPSAPWIYTNERGEPVLGGLGQPEAINTMMPVEGDIDNQAVNLNQRGAYFDAGAVNITDGALRALKQMLEIPIPGDVASSARFSPDSPEAVVENYQSQFATNIAMQFISRHTGGDWGTAFNDDSDRALNQLSVYDGGMIFSRYELGGNIFYVKTEPKIGARPIFSPDGPPGMFRIRQVGRQASRIPDMPGAERGNALHNIMRERTTIMLANEW